MTFESFLTRRGFVGDPFAFTNAEQEDRLADYFVPPPYFESVLGDPRSPKTNVIFAPRGSGKTAQRLMIERASINRTGNFLCLTYDNFNVVQKAGGSLEAHQAELCRLLLIGILARLEDAFYEAAWLQPQDREILKQGARKYLGRLTMGDYEVAIRAVKTLGDRVTEFWKTYGGPVAIGVTLLLKQAGLGDVDLSSAKVGEQAGGADAPDRYYFESLVSIALKLGWDAVYFLIDKVDETAATTTNAEVAAKLIGQLVTDLPTVETKGAAFKFFLWDRMEVYLRQAGLRSDRMEAVVLGWTPTELAQMLSRRLGSYSDNTVKSFNQLLAPDVDVDVQLLLVHLSHGSPRDLIRMARAIVTEHTRMGNEPDQIVLSTVYRGVQVFAKQSTSERFAQYQGDFSRVSEPSYTLTGLASIFKISATGAANKTQAWQTAGAVQNLGTKANPGKKPLNLYGFTDMRIVLASGTVADVARSLQNYAFECPACKTIVIEGEEEVDCPICGAKIISSDARSLLAVCSSSRAA